jgi:hypothetical protein
MVDRKKAKYVINPNTYVVSLREQKRRYFEGKRKFGPHFLY